MATAPRQEILRVIIVASLWSRPGSCSTGCGVMPAAGSIDHGGTFFFFCRESLENMPFFRHKRIKRHDDPSRYIRGRCEGRGGEHGRSLPLAGLRALVLRDDDQLHGSSDPLAAQAAFWTAS